MPTKCAYIHVPFCLSKCKYCSFVSFNKLELKKAYVFSLLKEIDYYYQNEELNTIYFGGGTPSLLTIDELKKILKKLNFDETTEITIEVNPNDISAEYLKELKNIGFNRLSIGSQTFKDDILNLIGRRHNSDEIINTVKLAKEAGFNNISLDLIYGLPTQKIQDFKKDIDTLLSLGVQHISMYGLKIEEGCSFYKSPPQNLPDDDMQADMYLLAISETTKNGFSHYEISNFAKEGFESKHNLNYWSENPYYGFGVAAHGFVDGVRYSNYCTIEEYIDNPTSHEFGAFITEKEKLEETIFLGLRKSQGINIKEINNTYNINFDDKYKNTISKYLETGHLKKTDNGYKLSDNKQTNGFLVSNIILSEFI